MVTFIVVFIIWLLASSITARTWNVWKLVSTKNVLIFLTPFLVLTALAQAGDEITRNRSGLSLKETFDLYLRSIHNSDLEGLFSTVSDSDDFFFLASNGKLLNRDEYHKFHQDWFKDTNWEMPVELLEVKEGTEYGYTNAIFYYRQKTPDGGTYNLESYFTLIFRREDRM